MLFYFNAFINWPGYEAFKTYRDEWTLTDKNGKFVTHTSGTPRPDPSNAEFREWRSEVVAKANHSALLGGVFIDALPQALTLGLAAQVGDVKAREVDTSPLASNQLLTVQALSKVFINAAACRCF